MPEMWREVFGKSSLGRQPDKHGYSDSACGAMRSTWTASLRNVPTITNLYVLVQYVAKRYD